MGLRGKRILITAGPTCVPIDSVRVISNIASGATGVLLARRASARQARVTLLSGLHNADSLGKSVRIIHFRFFNELKDALKRELQHNRYDIIIHSAAVSDFAPKYKLSGKLESGRAYNLRLQPLEKLIVLIRRLAPKAKLIMFKLETGAADRQLIQKAEAARQKAGADLVVANRLNPYRAFILNKHKIYFKCGSKKELAKRLVNLL
jgi:phosphopantothenoylcysteine decarboxylase/phosphopantothenate--cysteine ligase